MEVVPLQGGTFSAQLVPQIAALLSKHNLNKADIDAFAVVSGPGSFTGLRVGLAAIKALAEILRKPIAAVSLLEVIAFEASLSSHVSRNGDETAPLPVVPAKSGREVLIALDAGRNEVFVGRYKPVSEFPASVSESLLTLDELAEQARGSRQAVLTPDETVMQNVSSRIGTSDPFKVLRVDRPNAVSVARLGHKRLLAGHAVSPEQLDATYIRRADAEIKQPRRTPA